VSNALSSASSSLATVTLTNNWPATFTLLFVDGPYPSPYETALARLGYPYQKYSSAASFNQAVATANRNNTLVIVDSTYYLQDFSSVRSFINLGGRAIVQAYVLAADATLGTALDVTLERRFTVPPGVHDWSGSPFFRGLTSPMDLIDAGFNENGQKFHEAAGGHAVAGFGPATQPGEAAVVIGNSGRTIVNGWFLEDAVDPEDGIRFAQNQIQFLVNPVLPIEILSSEWVDGWFQAQIAGGRAGLECDIEASDNLGQWHAVTNVTLSADPLHISVPALADWSLYRAVTPDVP
jgi:hypothetical protein